MDVSMIIALIGAALSVATFFIGRVSAGRDEGKNDGIVLTELGYIKSSVEDIKTEQKNMGEKYIEVIAKLATLERDIKTAFTRIDELRSDMNRYHK